MPLFELIEVLWLCLSHVHMGSVFSLDLILFYSLSSKPSDASETWRRIYFSTGAQPVDPAAEYLDAVITLKPKQQQQQPTTTAPSWQLSPFSEVAAASVFQ